MQIRMIAHSVHSSSLDKLLRQSLVALAHTEIAKAEATAALVSALSRIACNFRLVETVVVHSVIEPACVEIRLNGIAVRAPRLLVQCSWRDSAFAVPLTLVYTPIRPDCIALQITYGNVTHRAKDLVVWSAQRGWHIPAHGYDVGAETHSAFLRASLQSIGLFAGPALSLEPIVQ
jgi:hypothetical protein